jgi:proliferating cell nuclear antigen
MPSPTSSLLGPAAVVRRDLEIRTVQAGAIKTMVEALKDLLTDTRIEFDLSGMKIVAMDNAHIVLVHLKLDANRFEHFYCSSRLSIGVNMLNLHKLVKTINNNDVLMMFIDHDDPNHLGIRIDNADKKSSTTYRLDLLDLDNQKINIDPVDFPSVITMASSDFQKICRDMNNIAEYVEIKNFNNKLIFSCKGEFCSQETVLVDDQTQTGSVTVTSREPMSTKNIVQGVFSLKYLVMFTKCTNMCNIVECMLKNDFPLIVRYNVASLGELKLALAPHHDYNALT